MLEPDPQLLGQLNMVAKHKAILAVLHQLVQAAREDWSYKLSLEGYVVS